MMLKNRIIVITGSTRGLGFATAKACLAAGATVVLTGRNPQAVEQALTELHSPDRTAGFLVDVRDEAQVHRLAHQTIERFGRFDIWINNAGYSSAAGMILDMNPREALDMFLANDLGALYGTQAAMSHFLPRQTGTLVNIYGNGSFLRPATPVALYGATKAWLTSFTRSLARETAGSGIRIVGFSPGMMTTEMLTRPRVVGQKAHEQMKNFGFVLRFLSQPPEIPARKLVQLLASQQAGFVEYQMFKPWTPLLGLIRLGWENLTKTARTPTLVMQDEPAYRFEPK
ncbi:MAG: SDR family oxidoreductase [Anaerolineales bacterium]|nr:SDR family oxidoreductase [Anaerolineales bacterium]